MTDPNATAKIYQVFVGNVPYGTTEERLRQLFSTVGAVSNVRVMSDRGDPKKGYAFVEYDNPDAALTAIQNLSNTELDGRRLRVGFSNNSGLEAIAKQRGFNPQSANIISGGKSLETVLSQLSIHEMYDMIAHLKEVAENKPEELRVLLMSHPQIAEAIVHMQVKIGMIKPLSRPPPGAAVPPHLLQQLPPPQPLPPPPLPPIMPPIQAMPHGNIYMQQQQQQQPQQQQQQQQPQAPPPPPPPLPPQGWPSAIPQPQQQQQAAALGMMGIGGAGVSQEVIKQILELTPEQLAQVDESRRAMLIDLRTALLSNPAIMQQAPR